MISFFGAKRGGSVQPRLTRDVSTSKTALAAPGLWHLALETRAPLEFAALIAAMPWLARLPRGDGHPVAVFPGLGASDLSTLPLRRFLRGLGYTPYAWRQGFNFGPKAGVLDACRAELRRVVDLHSAPVSLVGWSLGGLYARELAKELGAEARCVVTLGTPFAGHPRSTNAWRFYELVSRQRVEDPTLAAQLKQIRTPPRCPTTSIYSKSDGVVAWRASLNAPGPLVENIQVHASHIGMGLNPLALLAVSDRLAQDPARWQPFDPQGRSRRWFPMTEAADRSERSDSA